MSTKHIPKHSASLFDHVVPGDHVTTKERLKELILKTSRRWPQANSFLEDRFVHPEGERPDGKNYSHVIDAIVDAITQPGTKVQKEFLYQETGKRIKSAAALLRKLALPTRCIRRNKGKTVALCIQVPVQMAA